MSRFRVEFKVEANQLGVVLTAIHGHAIDLDVSIVEDVPHTKNRKQPRKGSIRELVLEAIKSAPDQSLSFEDAKKLLAQHHFTPASLYGLKSALLKKGLIDYRNGRMSVKK